MYCARVWLLLPLCCCLLVACSSTDSIDLKPAELTDFKPSVELQRRWEKSIGVGQDERYTLLVPGIANDTIFASDIEGTVMALDRHTGKNRWKVKLEVPVSGGVGVGAGLLLLGTYDGDVIALDQADGSERWRTRVSSETLAAPQTNGDIVVVQTLDGKLYGLNVSDGEQRWLYENTLPVLTLRGTATPVVNETNVFAGFATGKILALSARDGILLWEQRVAVPQGRTELERVVDVDGSPLLVGDLIYAVGFQGRLAAFGRANGRGIWADDVSSYRDLAAGFGNIYVITDTDKIVAYKASSGEVTWENNQLSRRTLSPPQTFDRYVVVGDFKGYVHLLEQSSGEFAGRRKIGGGGIRSPMVVAGDTLYVLSNDGDLVALQLRR